MRVHVHPLPCKLPEDHGPCLAFLCVPSAWHRASAPNHVSSIYLNLRLGRLEVVPLDSRLPTPMRTLKSGEEGTERKERDPSSAPSSSAATLPSQGFPSLAWPGLTWPRRRGGEEQPETHNRCVFVTCLLHEVSQCPISWEILSTSKRTRGLSSGWKEVVSYLELDTQGSDPERTQPSVGDQSPEPRDSHLPKVFTLVLFPVS